MPHAIIFNDNIGIQRRTSGAYKAANMLESLGWDVDVVDWVTNWNDTDLYTYLDACVSKETLLFGISCTFLPSRLVYNLFAKLKKRYPNRKYLAGGSKFFQEDINCDVMIYGFAERAVNEAIAWMFNNGPQPIGKYVDVLNGFLIDANKDYPSHSLNDYGITYRKTDFILPWEQLTIELSRGCKFNCKFCNYPFLNIRNNSSSQKENVKQELINNYEQWGTQNYIIADNTLNDRNEKLEMLAEVVEELPFEVNFAAFIRLELTITNPEQVELLSRARVWSQFYGVETFTRKSGATIGKGMDPERIKNGMLALRNRCMNDLGLYRGSVGMIAGLPYETVHDWQQSEEWFRENWSDNSWSWLPLEITTDTNYGTLSEFAQDWKKYGFTKLEDQNKIEQAIQQQKEMYILNPNILMWKSQQTDIQEATEFVYNWRNDNWTKQHRKVNNFLILNYYNHLPKDKLLSLTETEEIEQVHGLQTNDLFPQYVQRKIQSSINR